MNTAHRRHLRRRWAALTGLLLVAVTLVPLPFSIVFADEPMAHVWRLDGRLVVNGAVANPSGRWSFVAVGRPELAGESLWKRVTNRPGGQDVRHGSSTQRPVFAEPLAAAAGLNLAGRQVLADPLLVIEDRDGTEPAVVAVAVNGSVAELVAFRDALMVGAADEFLTEPMRFTLRDGTTLALTKDELANRRFRSSEVLTDELTAHLRWRPQRYVPQRWFRTLAVGNSHGMMIALVTYATVADSELGSGLHIAGTGAVRTDGTVLPVGSVRAKANAAYRVNADVFFYPEQHRDMLDTAAYPGMTLVAVRHIREAVAWLEHAGRENP